MAQLLNSVDGPVRIKNLHVVSSLKCSWFGAVLLTHCADHLHHALVFMVVEPGDEFIQYLSDPADSVFKEFRSHHRNFRAGH
jgi:hypothetical protein